MDGGFVPTLANTDAGDLRRFCAQVSRCVGHKLDPVADSISVSVPGGWSARNAAGYLVMCRINGGESVIIKRCLDDPGYIRRELLIASVKSALGWEPRYRVAGIGGVVLRGTGSGANPPVLAGWERRPAVMIHIGNPDAAKDMMALDVGDIDDLLAFCRDYGRWAAFNYLLCVRDRNAFNFVFLPGTQVLHSIDNEEGPLGGPDDAIYAGDVISYMRDNLTRLLGGSPGGDHAEAFLSGFVDGWNTIESNASSLTMLNEYERSLLGALLANSPHSIAWGFLYGSSDGEGW